MRRMWAKNIIYVITGIIISLVVGTLAMIAVYCIPVEHIRENVRKSAVIYEKENDDYRWAPGISSTLLDNFTDAIMINNAAFIGTGSVIDDAMNNPWVDYEDVSSKPLAMLKAASEDTLENATVVNYARYWHGYLVWLKPLLYFLTVSDIRVLNMCIQFTLLFFVLIELYKKKGYRIAIPFGLAILMINPVTTALCMQLSCIYYITLIAALFMLCTDLYKKDTYWHIFLWIGISTAYFDFLTYPLVGLGINLLLVLALRDDAVNNILESTKKIIAGSAVWGMGYAGMWSGKWLISYLLTGDNTIADGIKNAKIRLSGDGAEEAGFDTNSIIQIIKYNLAELKNKPMLLVILICVLLIVFIIVVKKYKISIHIQSMISLGIVACYPFFWFFILKNHSAIHRYMAHRNFAISIFAFGIFVFDTLQKKEREF